MLAVLDFTKLTLFLKSVTELFEKLVQTEEDDTIGFKLDFELNESFSASGVDASFFKLDQKLYLY